MIQTGSAVWLSSDVLLRIYWSCASLFDWMNRPLQITIAQESIQYSQIALQITNDLSINILQANISEKISDDLKWPS